MWRVAKTEDSSVVVAVAESWSWINYLVEKEIVDFNIDCAENDSLCGQEISYTSRYLKLDLNVCIKTVCYYFLTLTTWPSL